uniref:Cyclin B1 n=1 Tax=Accipiter nisus TaxID=211598 RepID=A0A8B9M4D8_9AVES
MLRRPPRSTPGRTLFPSPPLFRSPPLLGEGRVPATPPSPSSPGHRFWARGECPHLLTPPPQALLTLQLRGCSHAFPPAPPAPKFTTHGLAPQSPIPMEVSECSLSDDTLCQAFSDVLLDVEDVDEEDASDPSLCSSYVKDIYKYLRQLEVSRSRPQYLDGQKINGNMRATLMDWLVQVQLKFRLQQETLYLAVAVTDRFLQDNPVSKKLLQLVGTTAIFIASKYEEMFPPHIGDFTYVTDYTYTKLEICQMEVKILQALDFGLSLPLPPHFLRRISNVLEMDFQQHCLAKYLMELSILDYDMVHFLPSKTAAAACCLALQLTGYEWCGFMNRINLITLISLQAIKDKYASSSNGKISTIGQLNSSWLWDLAQPLLK